MNEIKIYLDVCCLNRPFDDLEQERIKLEAEAIKTIIRYCQNQTWILINSDALKFEMSKNPDTFKTEQISNILKLATVEINHNMDIDTIRV